MRHAEIYRETKETRIRLKLELDGAGNSSVHTGIGFFDHMLDQIAAHALVNLSIEAKGDLHIDGHHTVEDVGIALGQALKEALDNKAGIRRYGHFSLVMDEAWIEVALDLSGRPFLGWNIQFPTEKIGSFDCELMREFFQAFASHSGTTLHFRQISGANSHHIAEASVKAFSRALRMALEADPRQEGRIPSTKGMLSGA